MYSLFHGVMARSTQDDRYPYSVTCEKQEAVDIFVFIQKSGQEKCQESIPQIIHHQIIYN